MPTYVQKAIPISLMKPYPWSISTPFRSPRGFTSRTFYYREINDPLNANFLVQSIKYVKLSYSEHLFKNFIYQK